MRYHKQVRDADGGYSLIEILVVMIIIGILAGMSFAGYLSQLEKARRSAVLADVRGAVLAVETFDGDTLYPADQAEFDVAVARVANTPDVHLIYALSPTGSRYTVVGCHDLMDDTDDCNDGSVTAIISWDSVARSFD